MPSPKDIRWQQRHSNYGRALARLNDAVELEMTRPLSNLEKQGLIQAFEFTHELAWNVLRDFFVWQGAQNIMGSRDATRQAFATGLIEDGEGWMEMIQSRNLSCHTYNEEVADLIVKRILARYHALFLALDAKLSSLISDQAP